MPDIEFTQYLRPHGRRVQVFIERPDHVVSKACLIRAAGYRFECEHLTTGHVSLTISDDDGDYAMQVVQNGPSVPEVIDRMILGFDLSAESVRSRRQKIEGERKNL